MGSAPHLRPRPPLLLSVLESPSSLSRQEGETLRTAAWPPSPSSSWFSSDSRSMDRLRGSVRRQHGPGHSGTCTDTTLSRSSFLTAALHFLCNLFSQTSVTNAKKNKSDLNFIVLNIHFSLFI